ncbi:MAG: response regulator transcription factor [Caulobacteraceae bacterium]|nr:response regulator transcription factor [Caulobacteraceae bacterium]
MSTAAPPTILLVEDDPALRTALTATLKAAGYRPVPAVDAAEASRWFRHYRPDVILLDLGLPDQDGLTVIAEVRAAGTTPIVVLSARNAEAMKVEALDLGADDYVTKPFGIDELLARLRAALRHGVQSRGSPPVVTTGALRIDMGRRQVFLNGHAVSLSPKEYSVLSTLALNLGRPVSHPDLLKSVWGSEKADLQYLRVFVGQLRRKLEADPERPVLIITQAGVGYRLADLLG